jgi:hypothetical protein
MLHMGAVLPLRQLTAASNAWEELSSNIMQATDELRGLDADGLPVFSPAMTRLLEDIEAVGRTVCIDDASALHQVK